MPPWGHHDERKLHRIYKAALVPTTRPPPAPLKAEARDTDTEGRRTRNTPAIAGSARSMAHAVVITQVYLDEHGHGVVTCRQCGVTGPAMRHAGAATVHAA